MDDLVASGTENLPTAGLRRVVLRAVGLPVVVLTLVSSLLLWQSLTLSRQAEWAKHSEQIIAGVNRAQKLLLDHETGLRAYFLAGDELFLEPYRQGEAELPRVLDELTALVADNPAQEARVVALRSTYIAWKEKAASSLRNPQWKPPWNFPTEPAFKDELHARKAHMDQMRALTHELTMAEEHLLAARDARTAATSKITLWGGAGLTLLLGAFMTTTLRRWISSIERTYDRALSRREESESKEREARLIAEALAADITEQSRELEQRFIELRNERDAAQKKAAELER